MANCPHCHNRIDVRLGKPPASHHWQVGSPPTTFEQSIGAAPWQTEQPTISQRPDDATTLLETKNATSLFDFKHDVLVPLAFGVGCAGVVFITLSIPTLMYNRAIIRELGFSAWQVVALASDAAFAIGTVAKGWDAWQAHWRTEKQEWKAAVKSGDEQPPAIVIQVNHKSEHGQSSHRFDLPTGVTEAMFKKFVDALLAGKSTAESTWTGGGNLFSRAQYASIRDNFFLSGMARWKNEGAKAQGWQLTEAGWLSLPEVVNPPAPDSE